MLTLSPVSGGAAASGYYRAEGYYLEGAKEAKEATQFYGKAATKEGLTKSFTDEKFSELLDGKTPDGRLLGRFVNGERQHRPALDLTFSAPKSVSIAALIGGDKRIIEAHTNAVKTALDYVEANVIQTRRTVNGETIRETGGQIIAALFQHDTSRALDAQLHTHALVTNMILDSQGTYRSMSNDKIFTDVMLLGQIYRNALSSALQDLGYEVVQGKDGLFEIKGVPQELIQNFSKRREEILLSLMQRGEEPSTKSNDLAALATRAAKKPIERRELHAAWEAELKSLGVDMPKLMAEISRNAAPALDRRQTQVREAVDFAITHYQERNSIYLQKDVLEKALKHRPGIDHTAVQRDLAAYVDQKMLIPVQVNGDAYFTDRVTVALEQENLDLVRNARAPVGIDMRTAFQKLVGRSSEGAIAKRLADTTLTEGQKAAVINTLSTKSYVSGVQGYAGTGKTYMLETARRFAESRGLAIDGMAPSHKTVTALNDAVPNSRTVESALTQHEHRGNFGDKSKTILVVDEASMMSAKTMNRVIKMAKEQGYAKLVLIGDIKQLDAVGAGSPFRALMNDGMPTALMADIQRQNSQDGRETIYAALSGDVQKAMNGIARIHESGTGKTPDVRQTLAIQMADDFVKLSPAQRENTGVITLTNDMRKRVNDAIQYNLSEIGVLGRQSGEIDQLVPRGFSRAEAREIGSYQVNDIVLSARTNSKLGLTANTLYTVTAVDIDNKTLQLADPDGKALSLDLSYQAGKRLQLSAFEMNQQTVYDGDLVKFKITDRANRVVNSHQGRVASISDTDVTVHTKNGDQLIIPRDSLAAKGMQLAYAATAHDFQGSTVDNVMVAMLSKEHLSTQKSFYVSLSRMRDTVTLYTDDAGKLAQKIREDTGERIDALEALNAQKSLSDQAAKERDLSVQNEGSKDATKDREKAGPSEAAFKRLEDLEKSLTDADGKTPVDRFIEATNINQKTREQRTR